MTHAFEPLPGTTPAPRALFIDLWGTLLERTTDEASLGLEDLKFTDGAIDALFHAHRAGWKLYLIGNVESVAFGVTSDADWKRFEAELFGAIEGAGALIARSYLCLDHPNGRGRHRAQSVYQLPNTGSFYHAVHEEGVELRRSWVIADGTTELVAAWRAGVQTAGVRTGLALCDRAFEVTPDLVANDLAAAIEVLSDAAPRLAG